jgi:hypothetical protein
MPALVRDRLETHEPDAARLASWGPARKPVPTMVLRLLLWTRAVPLRAEPCVRS